MDNEKRMRLGFLVSVLIFFLVLFSANGLSATGYQWVGGDGYWSVPNNWDPLGPPPLWFSYPPNTAYLTQSGTTNKTITLNSTILIDTVVLGSTGTGSMTLSIQEGTSGIIGGTYVESGGIVNHSGGSYSDGGIVAVNGVYNLSEGSIEGAHHFDGQLVVNGTFNQTGGGVLANFILSPSGTYNLSNGGLGLLHPPTINGVFNQTGGGVGFDLGGAGFRIGGTYNLSNGGLNTAGTGDPIGVILTGTMNQSGGSWSNVPGYSGGGLSIGIGGVYNLSGGSFVSGSSRGYGVSNSGTINYSNGSFSLVSVPFPYNPNPDSNTLLNNGIVNLSGTGTRTIDGNVLNNGTFKTTHTTAVYTGTFTNNGAYISDPATQYFNDLIIGTTGYLVGQHGDKFYIGGNFINHSTMNADWNTLHSYLSFMTEGDNLHDLFLAGLDYGATMSAYSNNFSWGALDITGNILSLYDGNDIAGAALYLREILGLDISGSLIENISGIEGLNIYYMANLKDNEYLGGLVYALSGGGHLIPVPTPEPSTMLLLGSGLIGLLGLRRKFKK